MVSHLLVDILFLDQVAHIDLLRFLKLIFLFFLDILLNDCLNLPRCHALLDLFRQLVKDTLMLDGYPEQRLLELFVRESNYVVFVRLLVLRKVPEYFGQFLSVDDEGV